MFERIQAPSVPAAMNMYVEWLLHADVSAYTHQRKHKRTNQLLISVMRMNASAASWYRRCESSVHASSNTSCTAR
jgi:hypothetical protein